MLSAFAYYCVRKALGRMPKVEGLNRRKFTEIIGPLFTGYFLWLLRPVEQSLKGRVPPNAVTAASMVVCASAGLSFATGHLAAAAWLYILAGALDVLDGRLARATNRSSRAGAFLDSVSDRWGELFVFAGLAWYVRDTAWLGAVMLAVSGSMMVSYTRARGEGLDLKLDGGTMQRAERIFIVAVGSLIASWFDMAAATAQYSTHIVGVALLVTGVGSTATSIHRWWNGYTQLQAREDAMVESQLEADASAQSGSLLIRFDRNGDEDAASAVANSEQRESTLSNAIMVRQPEGSKSWAAATALESVPGRVRE